MDKKGTYLLKILKNVFNSTKKEINVIKGPKYEINGYFGNVKLENIILEYKNKKIYYSELKKILTKYLIIPNDVELIYKIIDKKLMPIIPEDNPNRIIDYRNIISFLKKHNIKNYFKDWVKQVEHPEIKNVAWLLAEKGVLLKKKEKNRVYYKYNEGADINKIFDEVFKAKDKAVEYCIINKLIESIADKEAAYIEIENSLFVSGKKYVGIYKKIDTPLIAGCVYHKCYSTSGEVKKTNNIPTIRVVLEEIIFNK